MILSEQSNKQAKAIIKHCTDNGMDVEATMGLWNHLVKLFSRIDISEGIEPRIISDAVQNYPCRVCGSNNDCQFVGSDPCPRR